MVQPSDPEVQRERSGNGFKPGKEPIIRVRVGNVGRVLIANVAQDDIAVELNFGEDDTVIKQQRRSRRLCAVGYAGIEGEFGIFNLDGDGTYGEAVGDREGMEDGVIQGGYGSGIGDWTIWGLRGSDRGRVRGSEKEAEVAGAEKVRSVSLVSGGEVGLGDQRHAQTPREAASRVCGVPAPELDVVEALHLEPVRPGVRPDEVGEPNKLEIIGG